MKKTAPFIITLILLLLGDYLIRDIHPREISLSKYEYYSLLINSSIALITLLAVIVALFKESIIALVHRPSIQVEIKANGELKLFEKLKEKASNDAPEEAENYHVILKVSNIGNAHAKDLKIKLDSLQYISALNEESVAPISIPVDGHQICWRGDDKSKEATIHPELPVEVEVMKLISKGVLGSSLASDNRPTEIVELYIGDTKANNSSFSNGTWKAIFILWSENSGVLKFAIDFVWNGKWEKRITEMKNKLTLKEAK